MRIKLSKKQWKNIGKQAGWVTAQEFEDCETIDYSMAFPSALRAEGKGRNVLILRELSLPDVQIKRLDGEKADWELEHRWLSRNCEHSRDEAWACVQGNEFTYWKEGELDPDKSLFDQVNLF